MRDKSIFHFINRYYSKRALMRMGLRCTGDDSVVSKRVECHNVVGVIGSGSRLDDFCVLTGSIAIGTNVHIGPYVFLSGSGGTITLGDNCGVGSHSSLFTKSEIYERSIPTSRESRISGAIGVGRNSIIGRNVTVLPGVTVGMDCAIGAGCLITDDIGDGQYLVSFGSRNLMRPRVDSWKNTQQGE